MISGMAGSAAGYADVAITTMMYQGKGTNRRAIRYVVNGREIRSNVDRPPAMEQYLYASQLL